MKTFSLTIALAALLAGSIQAQEVRNERIQFEAGKSRAVINGRVTGRGEVLYKVHAREGQFLLVEMHPEANGADFNIFIPDRGPGQEALFVSSAGGSKYVGQLYKTGNHTIQVYLNRAAAQRGQTVDYRMVVRVTDKLPTEKDTPEPEKPATGPVPPKVINDCLETLRKQLSGGSMEVIRAVRGENSFIVDVKVQGVPKAWRCFHDGTRCTGTEYQGEG